jgi:hypothetical protein
MARKIMNTPTIVVTNVARNVAIQPARPIGLARGPATLMKMIAARLVSRQKWLRLKINLMGDCLRCTVSAIMDPTSWARTNVVGLTKNKPMTNGISLSENECASRRICRWTTNISAPAKKMARAHHGIVIGLGSSGT